MSTKRKNESPFSSSSILHNQADSYEVEDNLSSTLDFTSLSLKPDSENKPIWVTPDGRIFLESFSKFYHQAYDFLVAIAEPVARPKFIHIYKLTDNSLYAAVAVNLDTDTIINSLDLFCKTELPRDLVHYIRSTTERFGKAKLVLKDNKYFVESQFQGVLQQLLQNPKISDNRENLSTSLSNLTSSTSSSSSSSSSTSEFLVSEGLKEDIRALTTVQRLNFIGKTPLKTSHSSSSSSSSSLSSALASSAYLTDDEEEDEFDPDLFASHTQPSSSLSSSLFSSSPSAGKVFSFQIIQSGGAVKEVKRAAREESRYPLMEEYDYRNERSERNLLLCPRVAIDLRPTTRTRHYQETALLKMFGNSRARSGIIVLPCGAGKSLTGITAVQTIKRSSIILCINNASAKQWRDEFRRWTTVQEDRVKLFTSQEKDFREIPQEGEGCILITTYSMMSYSGNRSEFGKQMITAISNREWGLMVLDEVHVAPANQFQRICDEIVNAHCKLGLTATLVREDDKIKDLNFLVGPKLYEANWIDLTKEGFLARVECVEVWCPMTPLFFEEYLRQQTPTGTNTRRQRLLYVTNPNKLNTCKYLLNYHKKRGDKVILFSDDIAALKIYCEGLTFKHPTDPSQSIEIPYIYGAVPEAERTKYLHSFKTHPYVFCLGLSKVGDTALDIPDANVIIQVSSQYGARRQEAQRLGRILRPKPHDTGEFNAYFYSLVSSDTREMFFSSKRQQYLIDQGYTFKVDQRLAQRAMAEEPFDLRKEQGYLQYVSMMNLEQMDREEEKTLRSLREGEVEGGGGGEYESSSLGQVRSKGSKKSRT